MHVSMVVPVQFFYVYIYEVAIFNYFEFSVIFSVNNIANEYIAL